MPQALLIPCIINFFSSPTIKTNMSDYTSLQTNIFPDSYTNPGFHYTHLMDHLDLSDFEISDFLLQETGSEEDSTSNTIESGSPNPVQSEQVDQTMVYDRGDNNQLITCNMPRRSRSEEKKQKADALHRVAFKTKSEVEIMDDGYKWRKYGKKSVKNSPNPRNYYRCSQQGCQVKKRVERDREDASYVLTTYDGVHNHESPSIVYYNEMPLMVPNGWTLQASQSSCS